MTKTRTKTKTETRDSLSSLRFHDTLWSKSDGLIANWDHRMLQKTIQLPLFDTSVCVRRPFGRRCTGSCRRGRRADGWGLRGGGWAAAPAGCRPDRSRDRRSGSTSRRRRPTDTGWRRSTRWCRSGLVSSLRKRERRLAERLTFHTLWQEFCSHGFNWDTSESGWTETVKPAILRFYKYKTVWIQPEPYKNTQKYSSL